VAASAPGGARTSSGGAAASALLRRRRNRDADPATRPRRTQSWQAHRAHFYQRATDNGRSVQAVVVRVLLVNIALAGLAVMTVVVDMRTSKIAALAGGIVLVALFLGWLNRGKR
jgi:hypothetical protein